MFQKVLGSYHFIIIVVGERIEGLIDSIVASI
jgi:hypothetical protein